MLAEVQITTPDGHRRPIRLERPRYTLGRAANNELCFPEDNGLSRQHLVLERDSEEWTIADLNSKNGTLVNGQRLTQKRRLQPGDKVSASQIVLEFGEFTSAIAAVAQSPCPPSIESEHSSTIAADRDEIPILPKPSGPPSGPPAIPDLAVRTSLHQVLAQGQVDAKRETARPWLSPITALLRVGREFASRRPLNEMFTSILDLAIEAVGAERGVLMTLEEGELVVQASHGQGLSVSSGVKETVLRDKASLLVTDVSQDLNLRDRRSIVFQQIRTLMAAPLQTDERVIGLLYLDSPFAVRNWTSDDLNLLTAMANVAAIRLERERMAAAEEARQLLAAELNQAAEIQQRFLPRSAPNVAGWDIEGHNMPCRTVGGDYFDFLTCGPAQRLGFLVADIAGKGLPAALIMMNLQARVEVLVETIEEPADFTTRLNRLVAANCPSNRFITLFFCTVDSASGTITYSNAGHNPPLIARANGTVEALPGGGPVMGILREFRYDSLRCRLNPGDTLALFSDGVTEACRPDGEEFGEERLGELLVRNAHEPAARIIEIVSQAIRDFTCGAAQADDITLLIAKRA